MAKILVVDDELSLVAMLSETLRAQGHEILPANNPEQAWALVQSQTLQLVLCDIEMPAHEPRGLDLLRQIQEYNRTLPVIMLTGHATKERAVLALRGGAFDFVEKPFRLDELLKRVDHALFQQQAVVAVAENVGLKQQLREKFHFDNLIGEHPSMEAVYRMIQRVANTDAAVFIRGESGTGKELVAKALHYNSRRAARPFIAINCAAMPEHLLESELFGHRKGAFTGAATDKVGLFEAAEGGTIFLDEIGSMPLNLQSKLLRFLQEKELRRVGDTATILVDVRVLAATNEALEQRMHDKLFREDLYYRLSVIPIIIPPLRDRRDDIPLLTAFFLKTIAHRNGTPVPRLGDAVGPVFQAYAWPGNVRELQNALERGCALCEGGVIELTDLSESVRHNVMPPVDYSPVISKTVVGGVGVLPDAQPFGDASSANAPVPASLKEFTLRQEIEYIRHILRSVGESRTKAAEILGVSPATLYRRLNEESHQPEAEVPAPDQLIHP